MGACVFVYVLYYVYVCIYDIYTHMSEHSPKELDWAIWSSFWRGAHIGACVFECVFYYVFLYICNTSIHV